MVRKRSPGKPVSRNSAGFSRTELLVVLVVIGVIAFLLARPIAGGRKRSAAATCVNNTRQVAAASIAYAEDHNDLLPPNEPVARSRRDACWVSGWMDFDNGNSDNTNVALLTDPQFSSLAGYIRSSTIYKCAGDDSVVTGLGPRVRSISMNQAVGTKPEGGAVSGAWLGKQWDERQTNWMTYAKMSSMVQPTPAMLWMFIDEHPGSINDAGFAVQCESTNQEDAVIVDFPGAFHDGGTGISFADGHAVIHRWNGKTIRPALTVRDEVRRQKVGDSLEDLQWLQMHTSARR